MLVRPWSRWAKIQLGRLLIMTSVRRWERMLVWSMLKLITTGFLMKSGGYWTFSLRIDFRSWELPTSDWVWWGSKVASSLRSPEECVCHYLPSGLQLFVYAVMTSELGACPPFTDFERQSPWALHLGPTQLHPNGWAILKAFQLAMEIFERICFEDFLLRWLVCFRFQRKVLKLGMTWRWWVTLRSDLKVYPFSPYS